MDDVESRLARVGLKVASAYGFVLSGGHAVQFHGMGPRPSSEGIDLFSSRRGPRRSRSLVAGYNPAGTPFRVDLRLQPFTSHGCHSLTVCERIHTSVRIK